MVLEMHRKVAGSILPDKTIIFEVPLPKGIGKNKNKIASMNEVTKWHWSSTTKVKDKYKLMVKEWFLSEPKANEVYNYSYVKYELLRHNKRVIDADNLGFIIKWTNDCIKELGWILDDDKLSYSVDRAKLNPDLNETSVKVTVLLSNDDSINL